MVEVKDRSAYDVTSIWNTGHPENICTFHASSAEDALHRLNRLAQQAQPQFDFMPEVSRMVGVVVHLAEDLHHPSRRQVTKLI